jgi:exodeoxyribonuclease-3
VTDEPGQYTFWDYQAGAWQKNWGIRIDHLLLSPQASDRLTNVGVDSYVRAWEKPSDHVPVWADLTWRRLERDRRGNGGDSGC